jgi:hypothetical protein
MGGRTTAACGGVVALVARRRGFEHFAEDIEIWPSAHRRVVAKERAMGHFKNAQLRVLKSSCVIFSYLLGHRRIQVFIMLDAA